MRYRYWSRLRPIMPGTVPTRNLEKVENFDEKIYSVEMQRMIWGYVEYSEPLTKEEIADYELLKGVEYDERGR